VSREQQRSDDDHHGADDKENDRQPDGFVWNFGRRPLKLKSKFKHPGL
jgi:hypothetical protein